MRVHTNTITAGKLLVLIEIVGKNGCMFTILLVFVKSNARHSSMLNSREKSDLLSNVWFQLD